MKQIIYFSAKWCSTCQQTTPIIEQYKRTNPGNVAIIDTDYDVSLTEQYGIKSIPTVVVLENGSEVKRYSGVLSSEQLKQLING